MKMPIQSWGIGSVFHLSLEDGSYIIGQIVGHEPQVLNSVSIALFDIRSDDHSVLDLELPRERIFSILFVTRDQLDNGAWKVVGESRVELSAQLLPYESLRNTGFVGAKVIGAGIVNKFARAFYGLFPWDFYFDPHYLDKLLISDAKRPKTLLFKNSKRCP